MIAIITIIIGTIGVLATLSGFLYYRHRKLKACYEIICKKSSSLKPYDVLGLRGEPKLGFNEYYYPRKDEDNLIMNRIEKGENILITGNPLAGKTRAIYHALINLDKPHHVIIPRLVDINPTDFLIPLRSRFGNKSILILDDLDKFIEKQHFIYLLQEYRKRNTLIIASCRSGPEYKKLCEKLEIELSSIFGEPIEITKISREEGEEVTKQTGKILPPTFDGHIGSIFLPLDTMRDRFRSSIPVEKGVLRAIKRLYYAGIYREREIFSFERIKRVCQKKEIEMRSYEWDEKLNELKNKGFIEIIKKGDVWAEETYLDYVIEDVFSPLDNLDEMMDIFPKDAEALVSIGYQGYNIGLIDIQKIKYMKIAIKAYKAAFRIYTREEFPDDYAMTQNNLGNAYRNLAEVEDKTENCKKAIKAYEEALKVYTLERFPMGYAMTQNNLGNAYGTLADVEDKAENCNKAIEAFNEALTVYTLKRFPMDYVMTQNNLGIAYGVLADVEEKAENCKNSIKSFEEALKVYTHERFPMDYAMTQNNLGNAYGILAEMEDKAGNCNRAIEAFNEAIKVYTLERFPTQYAGTQNNLGNVYGILAEVEDKSENCKKAIKACEKALQVRTLERFPMQHAMTQNNLGNAYQRLAEEEDKAKNCEKAMEAYEEALKVYTKEDLPQLINLVQGNIRRLIAFCKGE